MSIKINEKDLCRNQEWLLGSTQFDNSDDGAVIQAVLAGQVDRFEVLVNRYSRAVFCIVQRRVPAGEIENVAQDVFISAFRSLHTYFPRRPFEHWLSQIARRRCYDYWRSRQYPVMVEWNPADKTHPASAAAAEKACQDFEDKHHRQDAADAVHQALSGLSPEDRVLVECIYFEELPLKETAAILEWSVVKTKVRAMRVRRKLRERICQIFKSG